MANTRLYEKWTWNIGLPEPFDQAAHTKSSTDKSKYNTTTTVATYHGPVLQALMEYMEMDTTIFSSLLREDTPSAVLYTISQSREPFFNSSIILGAFPSKVTS